MKVYFRIPLCHQPCILPCVPPFSKSRLDCFLRPPNLRCVCQPCVQSCQRAAMLTSLSRALASGSPAPALIRALSAFSVANLFRSLQHTHQREWISSQDLFRSSRCVHARPSGQYELLQRGHICWTSAYQTWLPLTALSIASFLY